MLGKLMKYDMRAGRLTLIIISIVLVISTIISGFIFRFCAEYQYRELIEDSFPIYSIISFLIGAAYIIILALSQYGLLVPLFIRFYKHLYTDEGYLTFTLPVKRSQIFLSKTLSISIISFIYYAIIAICMAFLALIVPTANEPGQIINPHIFTGIWNQIISWLKESVTGFGWLVICLAEYLLIIIAAWIFNIILAEFCITMGSIIAKKHKIFASVGIYLATNFVVYLISQFISTCGIVVMFTAGTSNIFSKLSDVDCVLGIPVLLFGIFAAFVSFSLAFYFATLNLLERKLNLA